LPLYKELERRGDGESLPLRHYLFQLGGAAWGQNHHDILNQRIELSVPTASCGPPVGVYFATFQWNDITVKRKMLLIK
jgi:hypothetical protein